MIDLLLRQPRRPRNDLQRHARRTLRRPQCRQPHPALSKLGGKFHGVSAAIEFAVLNLRVKHIVILGHANCGGVKAALDQSAAIQTEAMFISRWMSMLDEARLSVLASHQTQDARGEAHALEKEGVKTSIKNLRTFPFVPNAKRRANSTSTARHFDIKTGTLSILNHSRGEFFPL